MCLSEEIRVAFLSSLWNNPSKERKGIALGIALHTSGLCYNSKVDFESSGSEQKSSVQLPLLLMLFLVSNS